MSLMADFNTHIFVATAVGAVYATVATKGLQLQAGPSLLLAAMTAIGGVLPDIDLKESTPSKTLFLALGALLALLAMLHYAAAFSVLELLVIGALIFVAVRYLLWALFHQFTVHRGSLHSLAASAMFGTGAVALSYRVWGMDANTSWLAGVGVCIGCLTHLTLDEIYSVDFTGVRVKRSFGSALKIVDTVRWPGSVAVIVVTIVSLWATPSAGPLLETLQTIDPDWKHWLLSLNF